MGWIICNKNRNIDLRKGCSICKKSIKDGEKFLEVRDSGYRWSSLNRFHIDCINKYKGDEK